MLEKACMAVEEAAKGGGVYPEVLFEVAHQWYWLYEQIVGGTPAQREGATGCSASGARAASEAARGLTDNRVTTEPTTVTVAAAVTAAATVMPVISMGSTMYQQHTMAGPAMAHTHTQGLHPYTTLQTHIPCNPQYIGHTIQHMPRPAVFPVPGSAYPQVSLTCSLLIYRNFCVTASRGSMSSWGERGALPSCLAVFWDLGYVFTCWFVMPTLAVQLAFQLIKSLL